MGGRVLEANSIKAGLPVTPGEHERGSLSGRPVSRCLIRWVGTPLGHLAMPLQHPLLGAPHPNVAGGMRASPKDPLKNVTNYRSSRWRKDLEHVLKAYYKHNYAPFKEAEWNGLRDKFFKHLLQHQEEFKSIKENQPLEYMPYMARHFHAITGLMLGGLSHFMGWIKPDSSYHALVAQKDQLNKCPHLVEVDSRRRPQVTPSESRQDPVCLTKRLAWLKGPAPMYLFPWRQVDWAEAGADDEFGSDRPAKADKHFPSHSRMMRGGVNQYNSSTNMQESNHRPATMWLPGE